METVIAPIFFEICSYLHLDEKCARFPALSKTINQTFKQSLDQCCKSFISIVVAPPNDKIDEVMAVKRAGRTPYLQYASRIEAKFCMPLGEKRRKNLYQPIKKSLISGNLKALSLYEVHTGTDQTITAELFSDFGRPSITLTQLWLHLRDNVSSRYLSSWGALKQCQSLVEVVATVGVKSGGPIRSARDTRSHELTFLNSLPDSAQLLDFESCLDMEDLAAVWMQTFSSSLILPLLRRFQLKFTMEGRTEVADLDWYMEPLLETIMTKTRKVRPFQLWNCNELTSDVLQVVRKFPVVELGCRELIDPEVFPLLMRPKNDFFPHLKRIFMASVNPEPLLALASHRPIDKFVCDGFAWARDEPDRAWNAACIKSIARCSSLVNLDLIGAVCLLPVDMSGLLPASSWPNLLRLRIQWPDMNEDQVHRVVAAAPACRSVLVESKSLKTTWARVLAPVLHYCPSIVRVVIDTVGICNSYDDTHSAFTTYPLTQSSCQQLVYLSVPPDQRSTAPSLKPQNCVIGTTADYIMRQLKHASKLVLVSLGTRYLSLQTIYSTRQLPNLRCLIQLSSQSRPGEPAPNIACVKQLVSHIEFMSTLGTLNEFEKRRKYCIDGTQMQDADTFDDILVELFHDNSLYVAFKQSVDESGVTSREQFYRAAYEMLSVEQKTQVANWEAGDYRVTKHAFIPCV